MYLFNSRLKQKQLFTPLCSEKIGMYVCGPTVYSLAHLGNARPVVVFDVLYRLLSYFYENVTYVRNITDVDDKINHAALEQGVAINIITEQTIAAYHQDMSALGALNPTFEPKATEFIPQMIEMIAQLISKKHAYVSGEHVLFDVSSYESYGQFSKRSTEELLAGARVEIAPYKKNPSDFVLWKPSTENLPGWDSPWGRGRPGWHIECSAMSRHHLGTTFDIHAGGIDLIFPHHENEVAQSCCANATENMANYWLHNGHLTVNGEKMSKSLGNFLIVRDLLQNWDGEVIRLALLQTHYRHPLDWQDNDNLIMAKGTLDRWYSAIRDLNIEDEITDEPIIDQNYLSCLTDDLNTPAAIAYLHKITSEINKADDYTTKVTLARQLLNNASFLGILNKCPAVWFANNTENNQWIEDLIAERNQARVNKDFAKADNIRNLLEEKGIILEDKLGKTVWRK